MLGSTHFSRKDHWSLTILVCPVSAAGLGQMHLSKVFPLHPPAEIALSVELIPKPSVKHDDFRLGHRGRRRCPIDDISTLVEFELSRRSVRTGDLARAGLVFFVLALDLHGRLLLVLRILSAPDQIERDETCLGRFRPPLQLPKLVHAQRGDVSLLQRRRGRCARNDEHRLESSCLGSAKKCNANKDALLTL